VKRTPQEQDAANQPLLREPLFERGLRLFNQQSFFECHEVLEDLWRPERGPRRLFLQAVIHFAVAFYHVQRHNLPGAERQLGKGLKKLAGYLPEFEGVNTDRLYHAGIECLERIGQRKNFRQFPKVTRVGRSKQSPAESPRPARR
jgi:predicted metal-dependent hydrolase